MYVMGVLAAVFGVLQVALDVVLFRSVFRSKPVPMLLALFVKLLLYAFALWLLVKVFRALIWAGAIGFAVGFFPALLIFTVYSMKKAKR